jgi:heat-inducible transcriptional repressor
MLDDRKTAILRAVVQEYISTAQPVGSSHIARAAEIGVSSATVRNEMAALEQEGYLVQPHTSAGRVPTDLGYRFFVDHLAAPGRVDASTTREVGAFFRAAHGRLEEMLHHTSDLLTRLTNNAAVVLGPKAEAATIRSVQVVRLTASSATAVFVFSTGNVESEIIEIDDQTSDAAVAAASVHLSNTMAGGTIADIDAETLWSTRSGSPRMTITCMSAVRRPSPPRSRRSKSSARCCTRSSSSSSSCHWCETSSTVACRWRSGSNTVSSRCRRVRSWSRP